MKFKFNQYIQGTAEVSFIPGTVHSFGEDRNGTPVLRIGQDDMKGFAHRRLPLLIRKAVRLAREHSLSTIAFDVKTVPFSLLGDNEKEAGRIFAENVIMANYEFTRYKSEKKTYRGIETVFVKNADTTFKKEVAIGEIVGNEVNASRDLANTPGGDMTPTVLAKAAQAAVKGTPVKVTVLEKKDIEKLGMGLVLGVDKGSAEPLKFIILEYRGFAQTKRGSTEKEGERPIVLVGKGITFDTGGINLKPGEALLGMNQDMTGGATVIATIIAAAKLGLKKHIIALVPAVENSVSGSAYRPGDVLTSMNGKTVEILNTDAEGRLVLADALTYAERYNPRLVVDVATLTGAAIVVAGKRASVIMTKQEQLETKLKKLGEESGDYVVPLPLWEECNVDLKSAVADIANVNGTGSSAKSGAGCIQGGSFLSHFTTKFDAWAHIDIASRMESIPDDALANGSTGAPIRLLVRLLQNY